MTTPENPSFWRADNLATSDQVVAIREQLLVPEYLSSPNPMVFRIIPADEDDLFQTLRITSKCLPETKDNAYPWELVSADITEQTDVIAPLDRTMPFYARRSVYGIGIVWNEPDTAQLAIRIAKYDITRELLLKRRLGEARLELRNTPPKTPVREEAAVAVAACHKNYLRTFHEIRRRAPYCAVTATEIEKLLQVLQAPKEQILPSAS